MGFRVRIRRSLPVAATFLAAALVSACGGASVPPLEPEQIASFQEAGNFPHAEYRLEPGDSIEIRFPFHPEMNQEEVVRPDGRIGIKTGGEIEIAGRTPTEVEQLLVKETSKNLREPEVEVTIVSFAPKSVYVTGEVGKPGMVEYRKGLTPLQAVVDAGGFLETAQVDYVVLIRSAGPGERFVSRALDLREVVENGADQPLHLAPRDVVFVPKTKIALADLWVDQHITRLFPFIRGTSTSVPLGF